MMLLRLSTTPLIRRRSGRYWLRVETSRVFLWRRSFTTIPRDTTLTSPKLFWSNRVVFGSRSSSGKNNRNDVNKIQYGSSIQPGCILVNHLGIIEECFPGLSREEALSMAARSSTTNIGTKRHGHVEFIDLTESVAKSTMTGDEENLCLSPGLIDVHTHISSLGRNWEGYSTATEAAAAGGITTIIGMPLNSLPPTVSIDEVEQELECANSESTDLHVDVGLWGGVLPETAGQKQQLSGLLSHPNVLGLKVFLSPLPKGAGYQAISPSQLLDVAELCGRFEKPILVHSELMTVQQQQNAMAEMYPDDGSLDDSHDAHVKSRPTKWEQDAVKVVIEASQFCHMHIVHLSDGIGCLPLIEESRKRRMESGNASSSEKKNHQQRHQNLTVLTVETCPHYLLFDSDQISKSNDLQNDLQSKIRKANSFLYDCQQAFWN